MFTELGKFRIPVRDRGLRYGFWQSRRFDPVASPTLFWTAIAASAAAPVAMSALNKPNTPQAKVAPNKVTQQALAQESEADKQNKRQAASMVGKDFSKPPKLSQTGLLGW